MLPAETNYPKHTIQVFSRSMAYVDEGRGQPIVLLHGNPTSSYLWRNVIPHLTSLGRCIAPDLIGMGDSDKLEHSGPEAYRFMEAIVQPLNWSDWPEQARKIFKKLRSAEGEELVLKNNAFVEKILPASILRRLTDTEMAEYRRPFFHPGEGRRPTLTWPREIPIHPP
ncbi:MAG TPA: alpha/beta fold hydrolase [Desulfosalsimonadaceae bacterium]|nr:alpha/beta fold hydrolase [Desulfosalsimonadaceae bacterium]